VPPPTTPTKPADINIALMALNAAFPDNCELITLPNKSAEPPGVDVLAVKLHDGTTARDPAVLVIGGVHAREWAPPDALLRLAQDLLNAFKTKTDITFGPLTAQVNQALPAPPKAISYPAFTIKYDRVEKIFNNTDLYILPCVNPDGRLFDILTPVGPFPDGWRKNRRPNPDRADPEAVGVDLNRNFDISWDFARYYDMPEYMSKHSDGPASTDDTDETFNGVTDPARTVTVAGGATGGSFTLSFNGAGTAPIAFGATAATVQASLVALATVGAGNVTVAGPDGGPYAVTFTGARAHPVGMLTADYGTLTGPPNATPRVEIRHAAPTSEPEVRNVQWLVDTRKIRFFLDVHQDGRTILVPWGLEDNGDDTSMTFLQGTTWDWKRDGLKPVDVLPPRTNYNEFIPNGIPYYLKDKLNEIGNSMVTAILNAAGADLTAAPGTDDRKEHSTYTVGSSARFYEPRGGPLTGASDDYAFSRQFIDTSRSPMYAMTIEVGKDEENGFHPDYSAPNNHYQKIEREVYASVTEFATAAARWCKWCLIATAAYGSPAHPDVEFLRNLRDRELRSTPYGSRVVAVLERIYYSFSPAVARFLVPRRRCRLLARAAVVRPVVVTLRALAAACRPIRPRRLAVGVLATAIVALMVLPVAAVALLLSAVT
jgi:hypothetical protein